MSGQIISLSEAIQLTSNFRQRASAGDILSFKINKAILIQLLSQPGCESVRIYFGAENDNEIQYVFVGVDAADQDMYTGIILDRVQKCPPFCPKKSPLNSDE